MHFIMWQLILYWEYFEIENNLLYRAPNENLQFGKVEDYRVIELEKDSLIRSELAEVLTTGSKKLM